MKKTSKSDGMIDVGKKNVTRRIAVACATVKMPSKVFKILCQKGSPKGDVLETAKVAGIMAAKATPQIIPMCHPLQLDKVQVSFQKFPAKQEIRVSAEVICHGRTGVEMEALTAAAAAALTIYDMMKWADKGIKISNLMLKKKSGGKSGTYTRK